MYDSHTRFTWYNKLPAPARDCQMGLFLWIQNHVKLHSARHRNYNRSPSASRVEWWAGDNLLHSFN